MDDSYFCTKHQFSDTDFSEAKEQATIRIKSIIKGKEMGQKEPKDEDNRCYFYTVSDTKKEHIRAVMREE